MLKKHRRSLLLLAIALIGLVIAVAFRRGAWLDWVGFKGKTVWDWLDLFGVPLTLAILGFILQQQQQRRTETLKEQERQQAETLSQKQQEIADNEAKEEILQVYFDRLSTLLVDKNILEIATRVYAPDEEKELLAAAVDVIRARTLSILRRFEGDGERKSSVIRFLIEAEIMMKAKLDLWGVDLSHANLRGANLSYAKLSYAKLGNANLSYANLIGAKLGRANLIEANLIGAKLIDTDLIGADLSYANLTEANQLRADLGHANLIGAKLIDTKLNDANLGGADLSGADLSYAQLDRADLSGVKWNETTRWPATYKVDRALKIPEELKTQLGITGTEK